MSNTDQPTASPPTDPPRTVLSRRCQ